MITEAGVRGIVIDDGSNHGSFSLLADLLLNGKGRVNLFDPNPSPFCLPRKTVEYEQESRTYFWNPESFQPVLRDREIVDIVCTENNTIRPSATDASGRPREVMGFA